MTSRPELTQELFLRLLRSPGTVEKHLESSPTIIDFAYLKELSAQHNVFPSVAKVISHLPDNLITPAQKNEFAEASRTHVMRSLKMACEYTRISELLTSSEIPHIPYKGPILAELYYPDPPLRTSSDLDIIVPRGPAVNALTLLADNGYSPAYGLDPGRWPDLLKVTNHFMMVHSAMGLGVEIHWELFKEWQQVPFDLSPYWREIALGQGRFEGQLSDEDMLVISCAHALKHSWSQLKWIMDIDCIIRSCQKLDWQLVVARATELGLLRGLGTGLLLADKCFGTPLPDFLSHQLKADKLLNRLVTDVTHQWFAAEDEAFSHVQKARFFLLSRERMKNKVLMCCKYVFSPDIEDFLTWDFGRWTLVYSLLRPVSAVRRLFWGIPGTRKPS